MAQYGPKEWWYSDGTPVANQRAAVFDGTTPNFSAIFSDAALTIPMGNPNVTDGSGMFTFYAAAGDYWVFVGTEEAGDSEFVTLGSPPPGTVSSVDGIGPDITGDVPLVASDVGAQPIATIDAKGDLYVGTANDATTRLPVGADGFVLTADSAQASGVKWSAAAAGGVTSVNGDVGPAVVLTAANVGAPPTTRNLIAGIGISGGGDLSADRTFDADYGTTAGTATEGNDSRVTGAQQRSTLTTKGDLYVATASATTTREAVGSDGQVLTADSAQVTGVKWATPTAAPVTSVNGHTGVVVLNSADVGAQPIATIDAKGDLYAGTANDATSRLAVGTDGQYLRAASGQPTGLEYHTVVPSDIGAVPTTRTITAGTALTGGGDLSADRTINANVGTTAGTLAAGDDSRITGAQQRSTLTTKGDIYVATASATTTRRAVGSNGQVLTADSAQADGVKWATPAAAPVTSVNGQTGVVVLGASDVGAQPIATIDAKGDLYAGTANDATSRLAVGTDGQYLRAASGQTTGLEYHTIVASDVGAVPTTRTITAGTALTGGGDLSADRTINANVGTTAGTLAAGDDSRITGAQQRSTLTTKGDIYVATASATTTRRAVGTDGQVLTADSAQTDGVKWAAASDAGAQQRSTLTTKGDLYVATASATTTRQAVGTNGYVVVADSAQTNGLKWATEKSFSFMPRSTGYISANGVTTARSSKAATLNTMFLIPFMLLIDATTSAISFEITGNVATAVARLGFYALDATTLLPTGAAVVDFGTTTADTTSTKTFAAVQALTAGGWALAIVGQTAAPTLRHCAGFNPLVASATFPAGTGLGWNNGWAQTGVTGGLPTIGTIADTDTPMCGIKF